MKTKRAFVPDALGPLEDRAVPAPTFSNGAAVLTTRVWSNAASGIMNSFNRFGQNYNSGQLYVNLVQSIRSIPYHHIDGLDQRMLQLVWQVNAAMINGVPAPIVAANARAVALNILAADVGARLGSGTVVLR